MELRVRRATQRGRSPRGIEAGLGCGRRRVSARRVGLLYRRLQTPRGLECVRSCARLARRGYAQVAHRGPNAAQCRRRLVDSGSRVVLRILVVVAERHGVAPGRQLRPLSACKKGGGMLWIVIVNGSPRAAVDVSSSVLYLGTTLPHTNHSFTRLPRQGSLVAL
jgi:hypothetical protein